MNREHQLTFCKICKKKSFDFNKGITCSLTGDVASFVGTCPDYEEDAEEKIKLEAEVARRKAKEEEYEGGGGLVLPALAKMGIPGGITAIVLGVVWILAGLSMGGRLFIYPFVFIGVGIGVWAKGAKEKRKEREREKLQNELFDGSLFEDTKPDENE